jgi:ABC-type cobalamin/Fe3+-siderophores transport system ATPase subunit
VKIELREVGFRYGNRAVNRGINLKIQPGEMIGLVGHSGSGKSTLVNLICRFYDVAEGRFCSMVTISARMRYRITVATSAWFCKTFPVLRHDC